MKNTYTVFGGIAVALIVIMGGVWLYQRNNIKQINSFEDCVNAGYPMMESYPEQCKTPDGRNFTNTVGQNINNTSEVSVKGKVICLPHKTRGEFETLECAYGISTDKGNYALSNQEMNYLPQLQVGDKVVTVKGVLSQDPDSIYDIIGKIEVKSISLN